MSYSLSDFIVPDEVLQNHKDLVNLIIASETISDKDQKQYWIDSIEDMDDDQMNSLLSILNEEKWWLQKISDEFNEDLAKEKAEKAEAERLEKRKEREAEEKKAEEEDQNLEEDLLAELDDL